MLRLFLVSLFLLGFSYFSELRADISVVIQSDLEGIVYIKKYKEKVPEYTGLRLESTLSYVGYDKPLRKKPKKYHDKCAKKDSISKVIEEVAYQYSLGINPFYAQDSFLKNIVVRADVMAASRENVSYDYSSLIYKNFRIILLYNFIDDEVLTLYGGYAILNSYDIKFYNYKTDTFTKRKVQADGFVFGIDISLYKDIVYFNLEYIQAVTARISTLHNNRLTFKGYSTGIKYKYRVRKRKVKPQDNR